MKIAVILGGISTERNISIVGGKAIAEALQSKGHEVVLLDPAFGKDFDKINSIEVDITKPITNEDLKNFHPRTYLEMMDLPIWDEIDVAFIILHGKYGEDGLIQSLFEFRQIPYTGSNPRTCSVAMDKIFSKGILSSFGILTPRWLPVSANEIDNDEIWKDLRKEFGNKFIVKPNDQGSSIGVSIVTTGNLDDIHQALKHAANYSDKILVEEYIEGREITCGLIDGKALPLIEIIPKDEYYNYSTKYTKGASEYICPADLPEDVTEFIQQVSEMCYKIMDVEGFCRIDFRLSEDNEPYFLELNPIPGFTSTSLVPKAAKQIGLDFPELCENLVNLAIKKHKNKWENQ